MTEFDINKLEGLHTASELLDKKYGRKGTESRDEFDGKARAWYYGEILRKTFRFITVGENLGTRKLGEETRNKLLPLLLGEGQVVLDF